MNSFTGIFHHHLKHPHAPPMYWRKPPPIKFWRAPPSGGSAAPPCSQHLWETLPVLQIVQKITESYCPCSYLSIDQVWWRHELWFKSYIQKMYLVSCTYAHRDVTDSVNHGMVKNTKTWISWERNIIFLRNKKNS